MGTCFDKVVNMCSINKTCTREENENLLITAICVDMSPAGVMILGSGRERGTKESIPAAEDIAERYLSAPCEWGDVSNKAWTKEF